MPAPPSNEIVAAAAGEGEGAVGRRAGGETVVAVAADHGQRRLRGVVDLAHARIGDGHVLDHDVGRTGLVGARLADADAGRSAVDRAVVDRDALERCRIARIAAIVARLDHDRRAEIEAGVAGRPVVGAGRAADVGEGEIGNLDVFVSAILEVDVDACAELAHLVGAAERQATAEFADVGHHQVEQLRVAQLLDVDALLAEILEQHALDQHLVERARADRRGDIDADVAVGDRATGHFEVGDDCRDALADAVDRIFDRDLGKREARIRSEFDTRQEVVDREVLERDVVCRHGHAIARGAAIRVVGHELGDRLIIQIDAVALAEAALDHDGADAGDRQPRLVYGEGVVRAFRDEDGLAAGRCVDRRLDRVERADQVVAAEQLDRIFKIERPVGELERLHARQRIAACRTTGHAGEGIGEAVGVGVGRDDISRGVARIDRRVVALAAVEVIVATVADQHVVAVEARQRIALARSREIVVDVAAFHGERLRRDPGPARNRPPPPTTRSCPRG